jgi:hypothetical protein
MVAAVLAAAVTIGAEAAAFAVTVGASWSWSAVLAKAAFSGAIAMAGETLCDPSNSLTDEHH